MKIADIKEQLPNVQVRLENGKLVTATVRGRRLVFAHVNLPDGRSYEYAWQTVADSINNNSPLCI